MKGQQRSGRLVGRSAALLLGTALVGSLAGFSAAQAATTTKTPIQHVVVLFQENITFDHYFGTYPKAAGGSSEELGSNFTSLPTTPSVNGFTPEILTNNPNKTSTGMQVNPFRLPPNHAFTCSQSHSYGPEQAAVHAGLMDLFVQKTGGTGTGCKTDGSTVMGYFDGNTVTALWNYAQHYAMSDNSFGSSFGPSTPGAVNLVSGRTLGGILHNVSGNPSGNAVANSNSGSGTTRTNVTLIGDLDPYLDDCGADKGNTVATQVWEGTGNNIGDLLNGAGQTWGWFQGGFAPTQPAVFASDGTTLVSPAVCGSTHVQHSFPQPSGLINQENPGGPSIQTAGPDYVAHHAGFMYYASTRNPHHLPPTAGVAIGAPDPTGANHNYDTSVLMSAIANNTLPAVSFVKAPAFQNGHPGNSDPFAEQAWLVQVINAIVASPAWPTTAIVIAYDDSDGWYDHVTSPILSQSNSSADQLAGAGNCGTAATATAEGRCGHAFRQPVLVISPWAKTDFVDHTLTDQASIIAFVEYNWNLPTIDGNSTPAPGTASFDRTSGSLLGMFNFTGAPNLKKLILDQNHGTIVSNN